MDQLSLNEQSIKLLNRFPFERDPFKFWTAGVNIKVWKDHLVIKGRGDREWESEEKRGENVFNMELWLV